MKRPHGGDAPPDCVDLSHNLNPLGPPEDLLSLLDGVDVGSYSEQERDRLIEILAARHGVSTGQILIGAGISGLLTLLAIWLDNRRVLVPVPTYTEYEDVFSDTARVETMDFWLDPDLDELIGRIRTTDSDVLFLCDPNNPTGGGLEESERSDLLAVCEDQGVTVVVDEAYEGFLPDDRTRWTTHVPNNDLVVLRSLTKIFAVPGLRIGYMVAPKDVVTSCRRWQSPWPVGTHALKAGQLLVRQSDYRRRTRSYVEREQKIVQHRLEEISNLQVIPSSIHLFLMQFPRPIPLSAWHDRDLHPRQALSFTGLDDRWYRFSMPDPSGTQAVLDTVESIADEFPSPTSAE